MKVAFFTNNFSPRLSGVAISNSLLKRGLTELGVEVFVFAPQYWSRFRRPQEENIFRIRSLRYPKEKVAFPIPFFNCQKIQRAILEIKPDLIHIHQPFLLGRYGAKLAGRFNIPAVFTYHTLNEEYTHLIPVSQKMCKNYARISEKYCQARSRAMIAPTPGIKKYLEKNGMASRVEVIPTGIDFNLFSPDKLDPSLLQQARQELGICGRGPIFLYVGRTNAEKNISFLIKSFWHLTKKYSRAVLMIIGSGVQRASYIKMAEQLNIGNSIRWCGWVPQENLPYYYHLSNLLLFPSLTDTQGIVLYEALAMGLPVIALDSMASQAIVQESVNGSLVAKQTPLEFARAADQYIDFKSKMYWQLPRDSYSYHSMSANTLSLYNSILSRQT